MSHQCKISILLKLLFLSVALIATSNAFSSIRLRHKHSTSILSTASRQRLGQQQRQFASAIAASASDNDLVNEVDVIVIGSGIAGLSCAAVLASKGLKVSVHESHYEIGGVAHEFFYDESGRNIPSDAVKPGTENTLYKFEAGPSLYSGLSDDRSPNPLKHVFQIIGEEPEWLKYKVWKAFLPDAPEGILQSIGADEFVNILRLYGGPYAVSDWNKLAKNLRPLAKGVMSFPSIALRPDLGALRTTLLRYPRAIMDVIMQAKHLTKPFSEYYEELNITDPFLKNYLNLLCFLLQGLPAEGTLSAVMAYMIEDFFKPNAVMDFPKGGSASIANALERGIVKHGGEVKRRSHVDEIIVENHRAVGIKLKNGSIVRARKAVVSNCDTWTTFKLVPRDLCPALDEERDKLLAETPLCKSFMHLHLGIDAADLPDEMPPQWTVCNDWNQPIDAPGNVIVVSVPSILDPTLAPPGRHVIHAYSAGNEPYELWEKFKGNKNKEEYEKLRDERTACLWEAIARQIPDIKSRVKLELIGTPLTHERFNRRYRGSYGPAIAAGQGTFPGQLTPLPGLLRCGDNVNPGIGVPAVAASGAMAAAALLTTEEHISILKKIRM